MSRDKQHQLLIATNQDAPVGTNILLSYVVIHNLHSGPKGFELQLFAELEMCYSYPLAIL